MNLAARIFGLIALTLVSGSAWAQSTVLQGGAWTPGHVPQYVGQGSQIPIIQDGGGAGGGGVGATLSELGITARGTGTAPYVGQGTGPLGTNFCDYDAPVTNPTGYHYLCISANATGNNGMIAFGTGGVAPTIPFVFNINGTSYSFPFAVGGIVGPNSSVSGDLACWNNTLGTLLKDCAQVTLAQLPTIGANTVLGSIAGGTPIALTPTQLTTLCNSFSSTLSGCVPLSGGGTANFLRADGTWAPASSIVIGSSAIGSGTNKGLLYDNGGVFGNLATGNNGVLVTDGSGNPTISNVLPTAVQANVTQLGVVTSGAWQGTPVAGAYGGTGLSTAAIGDLIYASQTTPTWSRLADVSTGSVLASGGVGVAPFWQTISSFLGGICTTSGAFPIYNATSAAWVCSTVGGAGSAATLNGGTLTINPPAGILAGLNINQTLTGSAGATNWNSINIVSDNVAGAFLSDMNVTHSFGGAAATGARVGQFNWLIQTAATSASNTSRNYLAIEGLSQTNTGDGGTGTGEAQAKGAYFGGNFLVRNSGTNVYNMFGQEIDLQSTSTSSARYSAASAFVNFEAVQGTAVDAGALFYSGGSISAGGGSGPWGPGIGFHTGILFGELASSGFPPIDSAGTVLGTFLTSLSTINVAHVLDLRGFTPSADYIIGNGFKVDPSGNFLSGVTGTSAGSYSLANATSGTIKIAPVTGALGSSVLTAPAATDTIVARATTDTLTNKTLDTASNTFKLNGTTVATAAQLQVALGYPVILGGFLDGINCNATNTDNAITITSPTANYKILNLTLQNTGSTASLTTATFGVWSGMGASGTNIFSGSSNMTTMTSNAVNGANEETYTSATISAWNFSTVQFRTQVAQGAACTINAYIYIQPQP